MENNTRGLLLVVFLHVCIGAFSQSENNDPVKQYFVKKGYTYPVFYDSMKSIKIRTNFCNCDDYSNFQKIKSIDDFDFLINLDSLKKKLFELLRNEEESFVFCKTPESGTLYTNIIICYEPKHKKHLLSISRVIISFSQGNSYGANKRWSRVSGEKQLFQKVDVLKYILY